jgi:phosphoribosylformylglycinamidine synthase PurS subunit
MKFVAEIDIMPHKELLDPQGKTVAHNLTKLNLEAIQDVRIGKHISLQIEAASQEEAEAITKTACEKILVNAIMENFQFTVKSAN